RGNAPAGMEQILPPALAAGLRRGDLVVAINGRAYTGAAVPAEELEKATPGSTISVTVHPGGRQDELKTVQLQSAKDTSGVTGKGLDLLLHLRDTAFLPAGWILASFPPAAP